MENKLNENKLSELLEEGLCKSLGHDWFLHNGETFCLNCGKEYEGEKDD